MRDWSDACDARIIDAEVQRLVLKSSISCDCKQKKYRNAQLCQTHLTRDTFLLGNESIKSIETHNYAKRTSRGTLFYLGCDVRAFLQNEQSLFFVKL